MGDRLFAEYQVINIQRQEEADTEPQHVTVGNYSYTNVRTQHDYILYCPRFKHFYMIVSNGCHKSFESHKIPC